MSSWPTVVLLKIALLWPYPRTRRRRRLLPTTPKRRVGRWCGCPGFPDHCTDKDVDKLW